MIALIHAINSTNVFFGGLSLAVRYAEGPTRTTMYDGGLPFHSASGVLMLATGHRTMTLHHFLPQW